MALVLGIETSCDETSAALVHAADDSPPRLASLTILSQDVHRLFGGVVPELASRAHLATIGRVVDGALAEAGAGLDEVEAIAVTAGPGLVGSLLVGVMYAKTLAWSLGRPLLGVHHLEGHLFASRLEDPDLEPPFVALLVSGGHTLLLDVRDWGEYALLGATRDDAAGEAFDKVGVLLGLGYPGGPGVERLAREGSDRFGFPRPMLRDLPAGHPDRWAFSFSGLKTAVLRAVQLSDHLDRDRPDLAHSFQAAVLDVLVEKTARAVEYLGYPTAVLGGGVACNRALAEQMRQRLGPGARVSVASPRLNADNAAMIAACGAWRLARGERSDATLEPRDDLPFPGLRSPAFPEVS